MSPALAPRSPPRRNMAARPRLPPSRPRPSVRRAPGPAGERRRLQAVSQAGAGLLRGRGQGSCESRPGAAHAGNKAHAAWGVASRPRRPELPRPLPTLARTKFGGPRLPPTSRRPPARRYLVGAPPPGPRPAPCALPLCSGGALTLAPGRNFPHPGTRRPARPPSPGEGASPAWPFPEGPLCAPRAPRPPGRPGEGLGGSRARPPRARRHLHPPSPARPCPAARRPPRAARGGGVAAATRRGSPTARDPPGHAAAAATPPRARRPHPSALPQDPGRTHNRFHSLGGRAGGLTGRSRRHHLRLARRGLWRPPPHPPPLYYDRRPQAGGAAARPAGPPREGARRGARGSAARRRPSPPPRPRPRARSGAKARAGRRRQHLERPCG